MALLSSRPADPLPGARDHLLELWHGAGIHDHEVRPRDPLGPAGLVGDPRLDLGAVHLPSVHQAFQDKIERRIHDQHACQVVRVRAGLDQQGNVEHDNGRA